MSPLVGLLLIIGLFFLSRVLIHNPEVVLRFQAKFTPADAYPEDSETGKYLRLLHNDPNEWLRQHPRVAQYYRFMGYGVRIIASGGLFIFICNFVTSFLPNSSSKNDFVNLYPSKRIEMQPEKLLLLVPIAVTLTLLLFPRQATLFMWQLRKWIYEKSSSRNKQNGTIDYRLILEEHDPRTRTDWFWQERVGAAVMLVIFVRALLWL